MVDRLCFWAVQVSFSDGVSKTGGAHLGLQWNPRYPRSRAVNWGGYRSDGAILDGTASPLPSTPQDPNTRDLAWEPGIPYTLRIASASPGWWSGTVEDPGGGVAEIRRLHGGGHRLEAPVVWSEIFTRCDEGPVSVLWQNPRCLVNDSWLAPDHYRVNYQAVAQGGCSNTTVQVTDGGVRQITATSRAVAQGHVIPVS